MYWELSVNLREAYGKNHLPIFVKNKIEKLKGKIVILWFCSFNKRGELPLLVFFSHSLSKFLSQVEQGNH